MFPVPNDFLERPCDLKRRIPFSQGFFHSLEKRGVVQERSSCPSGARDDAMKQLHDKHVGSPGG
eukprot:14073226-Heterocapsa_arctica.AAC.1